MTLWPPHTSAAVAAAMACVALPPAGVPALEELQSDWVEFGTGVARRGRHCHWLSQCHP